MKVMTKLTLLVTRHWKFIVRAGSRIAAWLSSGTPIQKDCVHCAGQTEKKKNKFTTSELFADYEARRFWE